MTKNRVVLLAVVMVFLIMAPIIESAYRTSDRLLFRNGNLAK
jgi:hypothetical protein